MLEVRNLYIRYGPVEVVSGVNFRVNRGQLVALLGSNGVGKTSILKAITGLLSSSSGEILFEGERIEGKLPHVIVRMGIGQVMEGRRLFGGLSVKDNLLLGGYSISAGERQPYLEDEPLRFQAAPMKESHIDYLYLSREPQPAQY